mmetsp:Transcript_11460/g.12575  ORF Transcript_11460/g.12575 Transcript_11460/m.12575 type:complete len:188 (+) Transcript_11460:72-635(+)
MSNINNVSIILLGAGGTGKTALAIKFVKNAFVVDYDPTIEDAYRKQISVDNQIALLDIIDTAGQEEFSALRTMYYKEADGFILVFSLTEKQSLDELEDHYSRIKDALCEQDYIPIVVAGNKCDLEENIQVPETDAKTFSDKINASFFLTSAKTGRNVTEIFKETVRKIRRQEKPKHKKKGSKKCLFV